MLPAPKNLDGYDNNLNKTSPCTQKVINFLFNLFKEEGDTNATRIVKIETHLGLRDKDYNILYLPSFFSKQKLYERFYSLMVGRSNRHVMVHILLCHNTDLERMMMMKMRLSLCGQKVRIHRLFVVGDHSSGFGKSVSRI